MPDSQKVFKFNPKDYDATIKRVEEHNAFYIGKPIRLGEDDIAVEYMNDQQVISLFFQMQVNKVPTEIAPSLPQPSRSNMIYDFSLAAILLASVIWEQSIYYVK